MMHFCAALEHDIMVDRTDVKNTAKHRQIDGAPLRFTST